MMTYGLPQGVPRRNDGDGSGVLKNRLSMFDLTAFRIVELARERRSESFGYPHGGHSPLRTFFVWVAIVGGFASFRKSFSTTVQPVAPFLFSPTRSSFALCKYILTRTHQQKPLITSPLFPPNPNTAIHCHYILSRPPSPSTPLA